MHNYYDGYSKTIEVISETYLVPHSTARWSLIRNNLTPRACPAVTPINDTDILICGGLYNGNKLLSEIVVFNTTTKQFEKISLGEHKITASENQCAKAGTNKVVALVNDENNKPEVISWTKGDSTVTILDRLDGETKL